MNFQQVLAQLNDLPDTFTRPGLTYAQVADMLATSLAGYTTGADGTGLQIIDIANAQWGWLDVWGLILDLPRYDGESDVRYRPRIIETLSAWVGTFPAIEAWGQFFFGQPVVVTENLPTTYGYSIVVPAGLTSEQIEQFIVSLKRIRPAGIPFTVAEQTGALYLDTIVFMDTGEVIGNYLDSGTIDLALDLGPLTLNAQPLLPDIYFNDPTLNATS